MQNVDDLYNNCYIFLRDIEKKRMEELEILACKVIEAAQNECDGF